ncbi:RidA family protein [Aquabacter spiritensis]|uniref:Enamine deaminase RidA (YjgF/YER057c/UK114 family) n=1 Tax=Aquabacter spiritensis TaxID=933073 RepID=A0A4R3LUA2_9HYPH|nr:RidA family protein [Aquabacter spiritensis]TCT02245.1 enamine deaminase RidA (YjgF/YER057c/UK114 family) [Aquabacter spiritensis]
MTIKRLETGVRLSHAVVHGGTVYLAGQVAQDRSKDVGGQTAEVLAQIDALLAAAGTDKSRILSAQIWVKDIKADFAGMNAVWDAWVPKGEAPARATVQADLAAPDILVEIMVVAAI